jgi:hypothetical protein
VSPRDLAGLRAVPLADVLTRLGAVKDPRDRARWKTDRGTLSVTGTRFFDWHAHAGGGGAIDLVMHLRGASFKDAVAWLRDAFGDAHVPHVVAEPPPSHRAFQAPPRDDGKLARVVRYLERERAIPHDILAPLLEAKALYADARGNAVFLHLDPQGRPVGAELRGTTRVQWRGMARGSRKAAGCFAAGPVEAREIVICESAIDAISCRALRASARCISTAGACPDRPWLAPLVDSGTRVYCGFDADEAGDSFANTMIARHPAITRLRPAMHDWNDELCSRRATRSRP